MRKIRIGNDIRLKLTIKTLRDKEGWENFDWNTLDEFDQSNVKQLRCYLINTSYLDCRCGKGCDCRKHQKIGFPDFYHPTAHNIHNCGIPCYHMAPANMCNYDKFSPDFHDFHWWPGYRGFGIYPEHFHEYCGHMHWHGPKPSHYYPHCHNHHGPHCWEPFYHGYDHHGIAHCKPEPFDTWLHPEYVPADVFGKSNVVLNHPHPYEPYYLADSQVLNQKNTLTCMFPAVQQKMCGTYKLVVVLTVFEQGWGRHNLHTYTIDKGEVFELVDEGGESGAITLDVDSTGEKENVIKNLYTESDNYTMAAESTLPIGGFDENDKQYNVYAILDDGTTALFNPYDWHLNELIFESDNPDVVSVDPHTGELTTYEVDEPTDVTITVKNADDGGIVYQFVITVEPRYVIKMGFSIISNPDEVEGDEPWLLKENAKNTVFTVNNNVRGSYLWIFSQRRIKYIKSIEDGEPKVSELSSGFRVPTMNFDKKNNYFCYRSVAPILIDNMKFKITFG